MQVLNPNIPSDLVQAYDRYFGATPQKVSEGNKGSKTFADVLRDTAMDTSELKFSKHAKQRLLERDIDLSDSQNERLRDGLRKADEKGIRDSLVLMDQLAFIVNVPSHTVVTAMDGNESKEKAFTNIDGAVIV
jgi:flagellar operon protein